MLMASDNMQFTVQASAMMSMHYIYVRPTKFKAFFCSTKSTDRNAFSQKWFGYIFNTTHHKFRGQ